MLGTEKQARCHFGDILTQNPEPQFNHEEMSDNPLGPLFKITDQNSSKVTWPWETRRDWAHLETGARRSSAESRVGPWTGMRTLVLIVVKLEWNKVC